MVLHKQTVGVPFGRSDQKTILMASYRFGSWQVAISRQPMANEELVSRYDAASRRWRQSAQRYGLDVAYREALVASEAEAVLAPLGPEARVLDCGIGIGSLSIALNSILPEQPTFHGIDLSSKMLATADVEMQQRGLTPELKQADILSIPYADKSFDFVMAAHVLEHLLEPRRALEEMVRVLKPGGLLFVCLSSIGEFIQWRWRTWAISEAQGVAWLESCQLEDITSQPVNLGSWLGAASIAFWGHRPATKRQMLQSGNPVPKTGNIS
jgi:demethylmenaquinone methyltransferase/2-methoxy-6-polyprenyl-1,4-benzoquinol methylase